MGFRNDRGIALVIALMTTLLVSVLTAALVLTTSSESLTAAAFAAAQQAWYAADSAVEWSVAALVASGADWPAVAAGTSTSGFVDGPLSGQRQLPGGGTVDLDAVAAANPGWHFYLYGRLDELLPAVNRGVGCYVIALVAPDGGAVDRLKIRAISYGRRGAYHAVEVSAVRIDAGAAVESWRR